MLLTLGAHFGPDEIYPLAAFSEGIRSNGQKLIGNRLMSISYSKGDRATVTVPKVFYSFLPNPMNLFSGASSSIPYFYEQPQTYLHIMAQP